MEVHASPTLLLPSDSDGLQRSHLPVIDRQIIYTTSKLLLASPPSSPERQRSAIKPTSLVFSAVSPPPSSSVTQPPCNSKCKESNISAKATTPLRNRNDTPKISSREKQLQERVDALEALLAQVTASEEAARRQATDLQDALHDARLRVSQLEEDRKRSQYDGSQWQRTQAEVRRQTRIFEWELCLLAFCNIDLRRKAPFSAAT